jgi:hypothetical protein
LFSNPTIKMKNELEPILNVAAFALDRYGKESVDFLYGHLFPNDNIPSNSGGEELKILYVGKRSQKRLLEPLLSKIAQTVNNISSVEITTIGHRESEDFFSDLIDAEKIDVIKSQEILDLSIKTIPANDNDILNFSFALPLANQCQNKNGYSFQDKYTKFDIIFCSWEFHFDMNWRLAHTHLLKFLNEDGSLVFARATGDSSLFDGNFKEKETETNKVLHNFMLEFDKVRNQRISDKQQQQSEDFFWNPEISSSDYYQMRKQSEFYFKEVVVDNTKRDVYKGLLMRETLKTYFEQRSFSYLRIGVSDDTIKHIIKEIDKLELTNDSIELHKRIQFYVAKNFMPNELKKITSRHWRYDDLIKNLQELNDRKPDTLSRKALDSLVSHDIFFPKHTVSCSFFYWLSGSDLWDYPVHLVNNHILDFPLDEKKDNSPSNESNIFKEFLELMTLESLNSEAEGKGVFRYLIKDVKNKMQISFQFFSNQDDLNILIEEGKFDDHFKAQDKLVYKVKYDKKRKPKSLKLAFTKDLFEEKSMAFFYDLMKTETTKAADEAEAIKSIFVKSQEIRAKIKDVRGPIQRFSIQEDMQKTAFKSFEKTNMEGFKHAFNEILEKFSEKNPASESVQTTIKKISKVINKEADSEAQLFLKVLISIALFIWEKEDFELSFYPSAAVENEKEYSEGLGGIVVSERLFNTSKDVNKLTTNQISLVIARNNALVEASNQIFYKIGISDHVNHQYQTFAQQSAIATIISRNGSHGIGSHAIPSLVNNHRDLVQKGNMTALKHALRDDDIFYKYLQDRFEFITQLGNPSLPKWTLTTWFGKDLMKRFLMQRHLLNNLASSESLEAFEFLQEGERNDDTALKTDDGDNYEFLYGEVRQDGNKWFISNSPLERGGKVKFQREIIWKEGTLPSSSDTNKVRVKGKLSVRENMPYFKEAEIMAGQIIIKVRLRQFHSYDKNGQPIKQEENTSNLVGNAVHVIRYNDVRELKTKIDDPKTKKVEIKDHPEVSVCFYGIICQKTTEPNGIKIRLGENDDETLSLNLATEFDFDLLYVGRRLIFTGVLDEGNKCFDNVIIHQLLLNKPIIHPKENGKKFEKDIPVSIVGGIVGYQAFYSILENIIRNAAKHNWQLFEEEKKKQSNLVVNIELDDQLDADHFICKIWTNTTDISFDKGMRLHGEDDKKGHVNVYDKDNSLVEQLRKKLESPIIDNQGKPKQEDIGVSEIKICAAFLAGKDWTRDPSVLKGQKALLKLKTMRTPEDEDGYIRTFVAWEAENNKLIPRLGYRFRLLKAKEFLFFSPDETMKTKIKRVIGEKGSSKSLTFEDLLLKPETTLDYECCILIAPEDEIGIRGSLLERILYYTKQNPLQEERVQEDELLKESIRFPHRLMVVCEKPKEKTDALSKTSMGRYLKQRIAFVDSERFEEMLNKGNNELSFRLYHEWVHFVEGKKDIFNLNIVIDTEGDNSVSESDRMNIPTLPFSLRGDNHDKSIDIKEKVKKFNDERRKLNKDDDSKKEESNAQKQVKFARHAPYDANTHFLESLSGGKVSFSTFVNIPTMEHQECNKFFMQLMESAQNYVLVLDERIMEYALGHSESYAHFENANILIPTKFTINNRELHNEAKEITDKIAGKEKLLTYIEKILDNENNPTPSDRRILEVSFKQQQSKIKGREDGRISTVIIHQTLLEKIIDKKVDNEDTTKNKAGIDDFIRWLKMEKNIPSVIIISGRGKNNNTSDLAKFIPFSDISSLLMQFFPEKWMLNRIIAESLH